MTRYLVILFLVSAAIVAVNLALAWSSGVNCWSEDHRLCSLVRYQVAKIQDPPAIIDTLFLGDSSLGHAVDARIYGQLNNTTAFNLALTGWNFNLPSYYNLFRRTLEKSTVKKLVLFMTPQDFDVKQPLSDDPAFRGYVYTLGGNFLTGLLQGLHDYNLPLARRVIRTMTDSFNLKAGLRMALGKKPLNCPECALMDYLPQNDSQAPLQTGGFGPASQRYIATLRRFSESCRVYKIKCYYMHGIVYRPVIENSLPMIDEVNAMVRDSGLILVNELPIPAEKEELGDTISHLSPKLKKTYTKNIHALLEATASR